MLRLTFALILAALFTPALAAPRVALVVGNAAYRQMAPLKSSRNDATDMAAALTRFGFDVILKTDTDERDFRNAISKFEQKLLGAELGLFYYAGHGVQVDGKNFLLPVDTELKTDTELTLETIPLKQIQGMIEKRVASSVLLLDVSRNNPTGQTLAQNLADLADVDTGRDTFVAFATGPGQVAMDGVGRNSPFTTALLKHVEAPGQDVSTLLQEVRRDVSAATGGLQIPWAYSTLTAPIVLNP